MGELGRTQEVETPKWVEDARQKRDELKKKHPELFAEVSRILFTSDPVEMNFDENTDEYDPEAGTIIPRLSSCRSAEDVKKVVHEEFVRWFGEATAGPEKRYAKPSEEIWSVWKASGLAGD